MLTIASAAPASTLDWLLHPPAAFPPATATFADGVLALSNGLVTRKFVARDGLFACTTYQREGADGEQPTDLLRVVKPEAIIELDGVAYHVGGAAATVDETCEVASCPDAARRGIFTDDVALAALAPNATAWQYVSHAVVSIEPPFEWTPGTRHAPSDVAWPPLGVAVDVAFEAPASSPWHRLPARHARVGVVVRYELYQGVPLLTKRVTLRDAAPRAPFVDVTGLTVELLGLTQPASPVPLVSYAPNARGEWGDATDYGVGNAAPWGGGKGYPGLLYAEADTPHVSSVVWEDDAPSLGTGSLQPDGAPGAGEPVLRAAYTQTLLGSAADPLPPTSAWQKYGFRVPLDPSMPGTEGGALASFRLLQLLHEPDATPERKSMGQRRMRRLLAPAVQENPIFMHLTADPNNLTAVDATLAQMKQVGFEMAIFSFGSGFDLESSDPVFLATVRNFTTTAHAAGIEVGAYDLIAETRNPPQYDWRSIDADSGAPNGNACFASGWVDFLNDAVERFVNQTGFAAIETDGPFGGQPCASTAHAHHRDVNDSVYRQNHMQERFYKALRSRNLYIHQPDDYFYHGASKSGMGYNENQYSLPRWEDLHVSRAGMFDDTRRAPVTQGWMFVPLVPYHAGGGAASFAPTDVHATEYEWALAQYFGFGVLPCWRGPRLYDSPATQRLVAKCRLEAEASTASVFNNRHRAILTSDIVHLRRADGRSIDGILHVNPTLAKTQGLAFFFNPTPRNLSTTVALPLYYTGATTAVDVAREGDAATRAKLTLARDYSVRVPVQLAARSFAWFTIDRLDDDGGGGDDDGGGGGDDGDGGGDGGDDAMPHQQVVEA